MSVLSKHSPLLALPKELRLMIYDELFTPLIQRPEHFDTYVLPSEWPKIDFTPYRALLLTCKEVNEEATTHFEGHFLRDVMVFFDNVADLASFYFKIEKTRSGKRFANMQACLHTWPWRMRDHIDPEAMTKPNFGRANSETFLCCLDMFVFDRSRLATAKARELYGVDLLADICKAIHGPFEHPNPNSNRTHSMRGATKVDVLVRTDRSKLSQATLEISSRQLCSNVRTMYTQMAAPVGCLGSNEWIQLLYADLRERDPDEVRRETGGTFWPGIKEYERHLKEEYGLNA
ncbi:hypothetical protein KC364_g13725 [Hortaea werneckii]|nr:hypothetical protein KC350_g13676 [Hortaea werneckii]KAI7441994.1 hypothetical protein KC364_g13725 [Hortaea werneckii]